MNIIIIEMKKIILTAFLALGLVSCTDNSSEGTSSLDNVHNESFDITTVQHRYFVQGLEASKEDEVNNFKFDSKAQTVTWRQQGEAEAWIFKVIKENSINNLTIEEPATKDDVAHLLRLNLSQDRKTIMLFVLDEKGINNADNEVDYFDTVKK